MTNNKKDFSKKDYLKKSNSLLRVSIFLYENGFLNDSFSRLYYSIRALFRAFCGAPEKRKWKHEALVNCFLHKFGNKVLSLEEKRLLRKMPSLRNEIDYEPVEIEKEKLDIYIRIVKKIFKEFANGD